MNVSRAGGAPLCGALHSPLSLPTVISRRCDAASAGTLSAPGGCVNGAPRLQGSPHRIAPVLAAALSTLLALPAAAQSPAPSRASSPRAIESDRANTPESACRAPRATPLAHPCANRRLRREARALRILGWVVHSCDEPEGNACPVANQSRSAPFLQSTSPKIFSPRF